MHIIDFRNVPDTPHNRSTPSGIKPKPPRSSALLPTTTPIPLGVENDPMPKAGAKYGLRLQIKDPDFLTAPVMLDFFKEFCSAHFGDAITVEIEARKRSGSGAGKTASTGTRSTHEDKMRILRDLIKSAPMSQKQMCEAMGINQANLSRTLARAVKEGELVKFKGKDLTWQWIVTPEKDEDLKQWMAPTEIDTAALSAALADSEGISLLKKQLAERLGVAERDGRGVRKDHAREVAKLEELARLQAKVDQLAKEAKAVKDHPMAILVSEIEQNGDLDDLDEFDSFIEEEDDVIEI